jgi:dipeptidyl aminopeptidase/acylaminoacyl peptidase
MGRYTMVNRFWLAGMLWLTFAFAPGAASAAPSFQFQLTELALPGAGRVWVYVPEAAAGDKLPVVLIGPAGSRLFHGMDLGEGDKGEHTPYAQAGFAVVTFDIPGPWPAEPTNESLIGAARTFRAANGGLATARAALSLAVETFARLDRTKVFAAGHSSAGTLALGLCAQMPDLRGCVAYAPATDIEHQLGPIIERLDRAIEGERAFLSSVSPIHGVSLIKSPVLIFNALDDDVVPLTDIDAYVDAAKRANVRISHVTVATGGHFDAMVTDGIRTGIDWMGKQLQAGH